MFSSNGKLFSLLACLLVLLSAACDPCDEPGTIEIDRTDRTAPDLYWQVTTRSETPDGPISSLVLISDPDFAITMTSSEEVEVKLVALDNESGVQWLDVQGAFGYTCSTFDGAIAFDGVIPGNRVYYDFAEEVCALTDGEYPSFFIDGTSLCGGEFPILSNGGYVFNGSAANSNDFTSQIRLTINFVTVAI